MAGMTDSRGGSVFTALRAALRSPDEAVLVNVTGESDRARLVSALGREAQVDVAVTLPDAIDRLGQHRYQLAIIDLPGEVSDVDLGLVLREVGARTEIVAVCAGEPQEVLRAFSMGAHTVLPRPLPDSDALLKAHLRWMTGNRRSRVRGAALRGLLERHRAELAASQPALAAALADLDGAAVRPRITTLGDAAGIEVAGCEPNTSEPDVVVVFAAEQDRVEARLAQARTRGAGAAIVVIDSSPARVRACASLYGGARAYLSRDAAAGLNALLDTVARRRQGEVTGRRLVEVLAKFGALDAPERSSSLPADLDAQFLTESTGLGGPVVPSGHEVLVVDDEVVVLTVLREALRRGGYRVTTASSAEQAIILLRQKPFDLVLTDKNLTGASGLEVLRFANTLKPAPAVVLITGYSSYDSATEAMDSGAMDYIEKPIRDVELLRQRIRRALSRRDEQSMRETERRSGDRSRVLLVELEPEKRRLLAEFLGRSYDVVAVANGDEALDRLKQERFDVVLADRNLPGVSGLRVIEQAQRLLPHCASVLYTAYPDYDTVKEAFEVGADTYLVRPGEDLKALEDKVAGALRGKGGILLG